LPRDSLAARCGAELIRRLDQFYGAAAEMIEAYRPAIEFSVRQTLEHPTAHHEAIACLLDSLLRQLAAQLTAHGQGVLRLDCRFACQDRGERQISVNLFQPTADPQHLGALLRMQWEQTRLPGLVEEVQLTAAVTASREQRQTSLFADALPGEAASLARLIERLSNRVGRERVVRPQLQDEAQVELAYRCIPLTGPRPDDAAASTRSLPGPWCRPLRLVDPPSPIDVLGIALDGPPALVWWAGRQHRVARAFGPERIETGWWRGPSSRRDYYRIETEDGHRWWLFRRIQDKKWFLHGTFD
jgi:protein ImuB